MQTGRRRRNSSPAGPRPTVGRRLRPRSDAPGPGAPSTVLAWTSPSRSIAQRLAAGRARPALVRHRAGHRAARCRSSRCPSAASPLTWTRAVSSSRSCRSTGAVATRSRSSSRSLSRARPSGCSSTRPLWGQVAFPVATYSVARWRGARWGLGAVAVGVAGAAVAAARLAARVRRAGHRRQHAGLLPHHRDDRGRRVGARHARPGPQRVRRRAGRAQHPDRARDRAAGGARGVRGAGPDRPRDARRRRPRAVGDGGAGRRGAVRRRARPGRGDPRPWPPSPRPAARRWPRCAGCSGCCGRATSPAPARSRGSPTSPCWSSRPARPAPTSRATLPPPDRAVPDGVALTAYRDRAGVAHQRPQARRPRRDRVGDGAGRRRPGGARRGRRPRRQQPRRRPRSRAGRHARAGRGARRHARVPDPGRGGGFRVSARIPL